MQSAWSRFVDALWRWLGGRRGADGRTRPQQDRGGASKSVGPYRRAAPGDGGATPLDGSARLAFDVYREGALVASVLVDPNQHVIQLGRRQGCDVQLEHPVVSRMHAIITVLDADALYAGSAADVQGGALEIIDLGSSLGTRVNGALVERSVLHTGDTIEIGTFEVQINRRYGKPGAYRASLTTPLPPEAG